MRIVGGRFRGRRLAEVGKGDMANALRPTTDRVRESLFNLIDHGHGGCDGTRVLDLFAGTGALGLEALSRGATRVMFVETGTPARALIRKNIETLGIQGEATLLRQDATRLGPCKGAPYDLIFADPPYGKGLGAKALEAAMRGGWIAPDALVILEENAETTLPVAFTIADIRHFGDTVIHIARHGG